jgi:hypothetical protein
VLGALNIFVLYSVSTVPPDVTYVRLQPVLDACTALILAQGQIVPRIVLSCLLFSDSLMVHAYHQCRRQFAEGGASLLLYHPEDQVFLDSRGACFR